MSKSKKPKKPLLSSREKEALNLLLEGLPNKKIALRMSPPMTDGSLRNLLVGVYDKLGFKTRAELIAHLKS